LKDSVVLSSKDLKKFLKRAYEAGNQNFFELADEFVEGIFAECSRSSFSIGDISLSVSDPASFSVSQSVSCQNYPEQHYSYCTTQGFI